MPETSSRVPVVGGNWKMNTNLASARALAQGVARALSTPTAPPPARAEVMLFPPFPYLLAVRDALAGVQGATPRPVLGAQDAYFEPNGAFTGEVSLEMLKDCGVSAVLCGHSERRHVLGESDQIVNRKVRAVLDAGLTAVLCVGETLAERERGETDAVNRRQTTAGLAGVTSEQLKRVVIAYEPVWAIGTGKTATPADAQDAHAKIRAVVSSLYSPGAGAAMRIQYGGSVKGSNAAELLRMPDIDGALVGGASLKADEFVQIVRACPVR